ncbi:thioredoxin family protein [Ornithinimicrobium cryptoxanthini]|uniref:Thioredoxin domain-containing protein n=1 Tax=Ornithinimicrobium cryptoxanthini TaxID=2934161 RepID=A0ABY4YEZ8_9MICO|nr:thioredoxin domain-containing protein [Ornithinimicrobium cryptoxanthini]USQ75239.1 thioredoxin domain-containing protein [Ornithinimicrobium cryptoxanthini]
MSTVELTRENLDQTLSDNEIVLIDWWAEWCGPCRAFAPVYEQTSEKHEDVVFGKVDTETQRELAAGAQITSIPTVMGFRDGILLFAQPGVLPAAGLESLIGQLKDLDMDDVRAKLAAAESELTDDKAQG